MAQTGYTPISIYYSSTAGNTPTAGNLVAGELAINTADGKLFYKDSAGVVQVIAGKGGAGVAGGSNTQVQYNSSGSLAGSANMTFNGTTLTLANDASISGLTVGKGGGNVSTNTVLGAGGVLAANTTGSYNIALGLGAASSATGSYVTAIGINAGNANTDTSGGVFIGFNAGILNTSGANNTAVGTYSLATNTTGGSNSAFGREALKLTTTGSYNTSVGQQSLNSNTTASNNTAIGYQAGYSNTTGTQNAFIGRAAGYLGTVASNNTFIGDYAGNATTGSSSTFVGSGAGYLVTTGSKNTILGGYNGNQGGLDIRTASNYIVLSDGDGNPRAYSDASGNWYFGTNTNTYSAKMMMQLSSGTIWSVGPLAGTPQNERWYVLNGSGTGVFLADGATSWTANSDERLKDIIEPITDAANKVSSLRAVIGKYKTDEEGVRRSFLIAQDVQAVFPEAVNDTDPEALGVQYTDVIPLLVAAIKELKAEVDSLKQQLGK